MIMGLSTLLFQVEAIIDDLLSLVSVLNKKDFSMKCCCAARQVKTGIWVIVVYDNYISVVQPGPPIVGAYSGPGD